MFHCLSVPKSKTSSIFSAFPCYFTAYQCLKVKRRPFSQQGYISTSATSPGAPRCLSADMLIAFESCTGPPQQSPPNYNSTHNTHTHTHTFSRRTLTCSNLEDCCAREEWISSIAHIYPRRILENSTIRILIQSYQMAV